MACSVALGAQQRGPAPGVRLVLDAFVKAVNTGSAEQYEAMAKEHFAPALLAKQTPQQRAAGYKRLTSEFGTITVEGVRREGPDAPLRLSTKGSTGVTGVIILTLEPEAPFRIAAMGVEVGGSDNASLPAPPINGRMTKEELTTALDAYLARFAADGSLSGVVLVAKDGQAVFEKGYGEADRSYKIPNTPAMRFSLGSINKSFTQIAIAQLVAAGKLAYTDTLGKLIPDYPQELTRAATLEQLLKHEAGIADFFGEEFSRAPKDRFRSNTDYYRWVSSKPPLFAPGARSQYCNGCYVTLGEIITRVSGMPYERYVTERIFTPAGMATGFPQADGVEPNIAQNYTRRGEGGQIRNAIYMRGAAGSAAGSAYATAADLLAYDNALRGRKLTDENGLRRLFGDAAAGTARVKGGYGIAGGAPGSNAILESDGAWTIVVLTNFDPPTAENLGPAIYRALAGQ